MYKYLLLAFTFLINFKNILSATVPDSPCPNVFRYSQNQDGIYGRIVIPNDYSGNYYIEVTVSYADNVNDNIKIMLVTPDVSVSQGQALVYDVIFPVQYIYPKVTRILFNQQVKCGGPKEKLVPGGHVTSLWAQHELHTSVSRTIERRPQENFFDSIVKPQDSNSYFANQFNKQNSPFVNQFNPFLQNQNNIPNNQFNPFSTRVGNPPETKPVTNNLQNGSFFLTFGAPPYSEFGSNTIPTTTRTTTRRPVFRIITTTPTTAVPTFEPDYSECGIVGSQRLIFGGASVNPGEFPWLVAIYLKEALNTKYICTGNLISKKHVLTAGHCVANQATENLFCVLGIHNVTNWATEPTITRNIKTSNVHQDYKSSTISSDADVAILILDKDVEFQRNIRPICMWQGSDIFENRFGLVAGWGKTNVNNSFSAVPQKITLPMVTTEQCYASARDFFNILSNRTFCAGNQDNTGPCTGDSGAGFIIKVNNKYTIRGIVSRSLANEQKSCNLLHYVVFADVAKMMNWVNFILSL